MEEKKGKNIGFHIIKNDPMDDHKGFGKGVLTLDNVSPVLVDVEAGEAAVEVGAMHARSAVEKGIKFLPDRSEVPDGKLYWVVWVTIDRKEEGPYYAGVTACDMTVNREIRRGYKSLPEHVNRLDKSIKRHIIVDQMDEKSKKILADFLKQHDPGMWERSEDKLKIDLSAQ
ncbi:MULTISPECIES: YwhD family protein [Mesobacillus]|uniref:YwhD family protein n=2 Tax=Mesobacillus TaxID=2675231 RepID=A0A0D6ZD53_9BACI|nr:MULTISPECIES: YwhD family protein [Mesobacillus]KIY22513.1 hypothetical protein UB32_08240 [Mesobacillus subterraneus]MDQ0413927.1 hypothetical protein [Mesobacillus stamsii]